jgi:hypothetical protein
MAMLVLLCSLHSPVLERLPQGRPFVEELLDRISYHESGHYDLARGDDGELGRFQIMPDSLSHYCWKNSTNIQFSMLTNGHVSRMVARWLVEEYISKYTDLGYPQPDILVLTVAAYNKGPNLYEKTGVVKHSYVTNIVPIAYAGFTNGRRVVWRGKRFTRFARGKHDAY